LPDGLPFWQLAAGVLAAVLAVLGVGALIRTAAILGAAVVLWSQRRGRAAKARRNLARLKELLEQA
jgi:Flp pilus assembly protein TadB